jgi:peptide deformylase
VHLVGLDLDGNELSLEADEFEGRILQHELDQQDAVEVVERLDPDQRKEARSMLRREFSSQRRDPDGLASRLEL